MISGQSETRSAIMNETARKYLIRSLVDICKSLDDMIAILDHKQPVPEPIELLPPELQGRPIHVNVGCA